MATQGGSEGAGTPMEPARTVATTGRCHRCCPRRRVGAPQRLSPRRASPSKHTPHRVPHLVHRNRRCGCSGTLPHKRRTRRQRGTRPVRRPEAARRKRGGMGAGARGGAEGGGRGGSMPPAPAVRTMGRRPTARVGRSRASTTGWWTVCTTWGRLEAGRPMPAQHSGTTTATNMTTGRRRLAGCGRDGAAAAAPVRHAPPLGRQVARSSRPSSNLAASLRHTSPLGCTPTRPSTLSRCRGRALGHPRRRLGVARPSPLGQQRGRARRCCGRRRRLPPSTRLWLPTGWRRCRAAYQPPPSSSPPPPPTSSSPPSLSPTSRRRCAALTRQLSAPRAAVASRAARCGGRRRRSWAPTTRRWIQRATHRAISSAPHPRA